MSVMVALLCPRALAATAEESRLMSGAIAVAKGESVKPSTRTDRWRAHTTLSVAARSDYTQTNGVSVAFGSLAATAQLRFASSARPYSAAVLFEYSSIQDRDDAAILATLFAYRMANWTMSFAPFIRKAAGRAGQWKQQSTIRYRLGPRTAFGAELIGPLADVRASRLLFGYYGRLNESLSVTVTVGSGIDRSPDIAFRTALIWRVK